MDVQIESSSDDNEAIKSSPGDLHEAKNSLLISDSGKQRSSSYIPWLRKPCDYLQHCCRQGATSSKTRADGAMTAHSLEQP